MARKSPDRTSQHYRIDGSAKASWATLGLARKHADAEAKRFRTGAPMDVYLCSVCQRFHTGRKRGRRKSGGWK